MCEAGWRSLLPILSNPIELTTRPSTRRDFHTDIDTRLDSNNVSGCAMSASSRKSNGRHLPVPHIVRGSWCNALNGNCQRISNYGFIQRHRA
jgi:hypothetical protein